MVLYEAGRDYQPRWPLPCACWAAMGCVRMPTGWRCAPSATWDSVRQPWNSTTVAAKPCWKSWISQPMDETTQLYQAILEGRFEAGPAPDISQIPSRPLSPAGRSPLDVINPVRLVGREQEMAFLEDCWQNAQTGNSSLALIRGEVGVGKTRLVEEFAHHLRWQGARALWGRSYEFEHALPVPAHRRGASFGSANPSQGCAGRFARLGATER